MTSMTGSASARWLNLGSAVPYASTSWFQPLVSAASRSSSVRIDSAS